MEQAISQELQQAIPATVWFSLTIFFGFALLAILIWIGKRFDRAVSVLSNDVASVKTKQALHGQTIRTHGEQIEEIEKVVFKPAINSPGR